jgi:hypothetical protein
MPLLLLLLLVLKAGPRKALLLNLTTHVMWARSHWAGPGWARWHVVQAHHGWHLPAQVQVCLDH